MEQGVVYLAAPISYWSKGQDYLAAPISYWSKGQNPTIRTSQ